MGGKWDLLRTYIGIKEKSPSAVISTAKGGMCTNV